MRRAAVILQARMGSTRLPGKVLRMLGTRTLLAHCVRRLEAAAVGPVIVATTCLPADDAVAEEADRLGCQVYRGEQDDVLARYIGASQMVPTRYVVRATADNPAVDIGSAGRLLHAVEHAGAEYGVEQGLPYGGAVEVIASGTLRRLADLTVDPADREHVTLFVKRHKFAFFSLTPDAPAEVRRPDLRVTVDTLEDAAFMANVLDRVDADAAPAPLADIIAAIDLMSWQRAA